MSALTHRTTRMAGSFLIAILQLSLLSGCIFGSGSNNNTGGDGGGGQTSDTVSAVQADTAAVDEGSAVTFSVAGTPDASFQYTVTGVSAADVDKTSGSVTLDGSGVGSVTITTVADETTEGAETMTLTVGGQSASVTVNDTSLTPDNGGGSSGDASACFNPIFGTAGTRVLTEYNTTDGQSGEVLHWTSDETVNGDATFNGYDATEAVADVSQSSPSTGTAQSQTKSYYRLDGSAMTITNFGTVTNVTSPVALTTTITIDPPREDRFQLNAGDSYQQTYTVTTQTDFGTFTTDVDNTRTYIGRDTVTVPAGTFEACKFEDMTTSTTSGSSSTTTSLNWIDVGSGLTLRTEADGDVTELLSGSINDQTID